MLLSAVVSLVTALFVAELTLRALAPLPYASDLRWISDGHVKARLDPGQRATNRHGNRVAINRLGFRGADPSPEPAPGTLRVIALGGSSTFGYDVTDEDRTWPARLASRLRSALGAPVEVVNLGLPGYDAANSKVNYLFTGRALHPHVVLVYHTWNDLKLLRSVDRAPMLPRDALSGRRGASTNVGPIGRLFWDTQLAQRGRLLYLGVRDGAWENYYTSLEGHGAAAEAPIGDQAWDWYRRNFVDLVRFARDDGVLPVLISQATLAHAANLEDPEDRARIRNELLGMTQPRLVETWAVANRVLREVAASEGAIFVDGHGAVPADTEHLVDHVHLTDAGADRLADAVARGLLRDERFQTVAAHVRLGGKDAASGARAAGPPPPG